MNSELHELHVRYMFDGFCKKVIKNAAYMEHRKQKRRREREVLVGFDTIEELENTRWYDQYPSEYTTFHLVDQDVFIKNEELANALQCLNEDSRDIILMYWFLDMVDREIGVRKNMSRRTVNRRRKEAFELLKEIMIGGEDE